MLPSAELLLLLGPLLLFAMAAAETAVPAGLLVPAGVALALASFLAMEGFLAWGPVLAAAACGGLTGDSLGYWIGRKGAARAKVGSGLAARFLARYGEATRPFFGRTPIVSVTMARTVSFVRTLMPATAGLNGLTYPRFLVYDLGGVALWLSLYVGIGIVAGESWRAASGIVGTGWAVLIVLAVLVGSLAAKLSGEGKT